MKITKLFIFLELLLISVLGYLIYLINMMSHNYHPSIILNFTYGVAFLYFSGIFTFPFFLETYILKEKIYIKDINIEKRKNIYIFDLYNRTFIIPERYKKYIEKESFDVIRYYNIRKKEKSWGISIPHIRIT